MSTPINKYDLMLSLIGRKSLILYESYIYFILCGTAKCACFICFSKSICNFVRYKFRFVKLCNILDLNKYWFYVHTLSQSKD